MSVDQMVKFEILSFKAVLSPIWPLTCQTIITQPHETKKKKTNNTDTKTLTPKYHQCTIDTVFVFFYKLDISEYFTAVFQARNMQIGDRVSSTENDN